MMNLNEHTQWADRENTCLLWSGAIPLLVPRSGNAMSVLHRYLEASTSSRPSSDRPTVLKPFCDINATLSGPEGKNSGQHVSNLPPKRKHPRTIDTRQDLLACEICGVAFILPLITVIQPHFTSWLKTTAIGDK